MGIVVMRTPVGQVEYLWTNENGQKIYLVTYNDNRESYYTNSVGIAKKYLELRYKQLKLL